LVEYLDESLWSARLFSFGIGTIIFALFSFFIKGEAVDKKTLICLLLAMAIVLIQSFWPSNAGELDGGGENGTGQSS